MRVRVLGQVEAVDAAGEPVAIGSRNQQLILAVLVAAGGAIVSADRLVDAIWRDDPPASSSTSLRSYVSRLRRVLGTHVAIGPAGYALDLDPEEIDAGRFERLAGSVVETSVDEVSAVEALAAADEALSLWRGRPFGDVSDNAALVSAMARLDELHSSVRDARAEALLHLGRYPAAIAAAEEIVATAPLREASWAVLVLALHRAGRTAEALRAYQRAGAELADAGLEPSASLRRAEAAVLGSDDAEVAARPTFRRSATSLVGRSDDVEHLERLVDSSRLVTLVGPGGVGKTRLATELALGAGSRREWGAHLVELASVADGAAVAAMVLDALGLAAEDAQPIEALRRAGSLDLLVVLDNCEHVIDDAAAVVDALVTGGELARVVATSRERLDVDGEHVWSVSPLSLGGLESPAVELFADRARAVDPQFEIDDADLDAVTRIVRRLDGLPLAIEMAASRVTTLPLAELADRLESGLDVLRASRRSTDRHRTLTAVVDWSEALLEADERALLAELSVFAGPVRADDVEAVTGRDDSLSLLCTLADRSLVLADTGGRQARFSMLETVRDHVRRRVDRSSGDLDVRYARHVIASVRAADAGLRTSNEAGAGARLEELLPDARAVHEWALTHDLGAAAELSAGLYLFAQSRLWSEPLQWASRVLERLPDQRVAGGDAAAVCASVGRSAGTLGDYDEARRLARLGIELGGREVGVGFAYELLADVETFDGRLDTSLEVARRARESGVWDEDPHLLVAGVVTVALTESYRGDVDLAEQVLLATRPDLPPLAPSDEAWLAFTEGEIVLDRDPPRALSSLARAIQLADSVGNRYVGGVARVSDCSLRARAGDTTEAVAAFDAVIRHWRRSGSTAFQYTTLRNLVVLLQRLGAAAEAAELSGTVEAVGLGRTFGDEAQRLAEVDRWLVATLGADLDVRRAAGARRSVDEAAVSALEWLAVSDPGELP